MECNTSLLLPWIRELPNESSCPSIPTTIEKAWDNPLGGERECQKPRAVTGFCLLSAVQIRMFQWSNDWMDQFEGSSMRFRVRMIAISSTGTMTMTHHQTNKKLHSPQENDHQTSIMKREATTNWTYLQMRFIRISNAVTMILFFEPLWITSSATEAPTVHHVVVLITITETVDCWSILMTGVYNA